jgi:hypothetical protein
MFGFHSVALSVTPNGDGIRAAVATAGVCSSSPDVEGRIAARIRQAAAFVRSVQITVGRTGRSLSQYVRSSCGGLGLPAGGNGRILLTLRGSSFTTTKSFTVRSRRWTVEYVNGGTFLQVFPTEEDRPVPGSFTVTKRGPGKHVMKGAGTYRLKVGGMGSWVVRVRDGA